MLFAGKWENYFQVHMYGGPQVSRQNLLSRGTTYFPTAELNTVSDRELQLQNKLFNDTNYLPLLSIPILSPTSLILWS